MKLSTIILICLLSVTGRNAIADRETHLVTIKDFEFVPQEITIKKGEEIRWVNHENRQYHSVWFEALDEEEPDYFFPEEFYEREFNETGSFAYRCGPHPKMTGIVHVID